MDVIIPGVQSLIQAARAKAIPIVYTTTAFEILDGPFSDLGLTRFKIPSDVLRAGTPEVEIDERIAPQPGERVIVKKRYSAFWGTDLSGYLRAAGVDTVILTGVTMTGCVTALVRGRAVRRFPADRRARVRRRPDQRRHRVEPV